MVTGLDILKEQIRVAAGEELRHKQEDIVIRGHAIECRINAEDPARNFAPAPGKIMTLHPPGGPGVRLDTHIYADFVVSPHYDSLLAKLICHGQDRAEAIARMQRALSEMVIEGTPTTIPFHLQVLADPIFQGGEATTAYLEDRMQSLKEALELSEA